MLLRKYGPLTGGNPKVGMPLFALGSLFNLTGIVLSRDLNSHPDQMRHILGLPVNDALVITVLGVGILLMASSFYFNLSGARWCHTKES